MSWDRFLWRNVYANTMSSAFEAMGMSLPFSSTMANEDSEKTESAFESSKVLLNAIEKKYFLDRLLLENLSKMRLPLSWLPEDRQTQSFIF